VSDVAGELRIEPIKARHLADLDLLFAHGDPRSCQCAYLRLTNRDYQDSTPAANRSLHHQAIRAAQRRGGAAGLLAYDGQGPVGWVSFGPREDFARLVASRVLEPVDDQPVTSVVCFVVAARARRRGVAHRLLAEVINFAEQHQLPLLEGYPVDSAGSPRSAAAQWRGPVSLFAAAGFVEVARRQANASARPQLIMRRAVPELAV